MVEEKKLHRFLALCVACKETMVIKGKHTGTFSKETLSPDLQNL